MMKKHDFDKRSDKILFNKLHKSGEFQARYSGMLDFYKEEKHNHNTKQKREICDFCGGKVNILKTGSYGSFYSCENFKPGERHTTRNLENNIFPFNMNPQNWLVELKRDFNFKSGITMLWELMQDVGYDDLRMLVIGEETKINNSLRNSGKKAHEDELILMELLKNAGLKGVTNQVGFEYQYHGDLRWRKRILDVIGWNDKSIYYIEIKNNDSDFDAAQFGESFDILEWHLKNKNSKRKLYGTMYSVNNNPYGVEPKLLISNIEQNAICQSI